MRFGDSRGAYEIETLPGSSQVAVSIHAFIFPEQRGTGHGGDMHKERLDKLKDLLGYDYVLCTVNAANVAEVKILVKNGWKELDSFTSSNTKHKVTIYGKSLREAK